MGDGQMAVLLDPAGLRRLISDVGAAVADRAG
jgi:hypothetical protein